MIPNTIKTGIRVPIMTAKMALIYNILSYIVKYFNYHFTVPFSLMKGIKNFMKLIKQDWRSETFLTAFLLTDSSVKAGTVSPILSSFYRATFHRFLSLQRVAVNTSRCCQRIRTLRSAVSTLFSRLGIKVYAAVSTVMTIRFVKQNTRNNLVIEASCYEYFMLKLFKQTSITLKV